MAPGPGGRGPGVLATRARERLIRLVEAFRGRRYAVVQTHDNPDPDCIGSAVALRSLIERYAGCPVIIAHGGTVGRSENRAMLRYLKVKPVPARHVDYRKFDLVCIVDSQPSTGYVSLPDGIAVHVVIDHHPPREPIPGAAFVEIDETAGSTCTVLGETFLENGIPIRQDVATALVYGMKAETQDLGRETTRRDEEVYTALYPLANKRLLSMIESERVPRRYFGEFARALLRGRIHDDVVVSDLGEVAVPDIVPEMADFLLRLEEIRWSCVIGTRGPKLYISVRASDPRLRADRMLRRALRGMGSSGGHGAMAGGQIPLDGMTREERDAARVEFLEGLLTGFHVRDLAGNPLVSPPSIG